MSSLERHARQHVCNTLFILMTRVLLTNVDLTEMHVVVWHDITDVVACDGMKDFDRPV